jgi:hypothetical protein
MQTKKYFKIGVCTFERNAFKRVQLLHKKYIISIKRISKKRATK